MKKMMKMMFLMSNTPWSKNYVIPPSNFTGPQQGPKNMPDNINQESTPLDFLNLCIGDVVYARLCFLSNLQADRVFQANNNSYYAKILRNDPVDIMEMRAFVSLRIMMEYLCYKPRYEGYWNSREKNFVVHTPGFGEVMTRDRFLSLWTYLKIVGEEDPTLDKTDKIYKVRPMLNQLLPMFRHYYNANQELSLDEGMIPTKNRLGIKQYIKSKPTKWGIKSFLLCDAYNGVKI